MRQVGPCRKRTGIETGKGMFLVRGPFFGSLAVFILSFFHSLHKLVECPPTLAKEGDTQEGGRGEGRMLLHSSTKARKHGSTQAHEHQVSIY